MRDDKFDPLLIDLDNLEDKDIPPELKATIDKIIKEMKDISSEDKRILMFLTRIASELFGGGASLVPIIMNLALLSHRYPNEWADFCALVDKVTPPHMASQVENVANIFVPAMDLTYELLSDIYTEKGEEPDEDSD